MCPTEIRRGRSSPKPRAPPSPDCAPSFISVASTFAVPAGRIAERHRAADHAFGGFVDGAVAARHHDQVRAALRSARARSRPPSRGPVVGASRYVVPCPV